MGIYDAKILSLKKSIAERENKINALKNNIAELTDSLERIGSIERSMSSSIYNFMGNIDRGKQSIPGNFGDYYKRQVEGIAKRFRLFDDTSNYSEEKNRIKQEILNKEDQIADCKAMIEKYKSDIRYYQSINIEPGA